MLTDLPKFLPLLQEGIDLNSPDISSRLQARALSWGDSDDVKELAFTADLILVSDCIYYEASVGPLLTTLRELCSAKKGSFVLLSYEVRDDFEDKKQIARDFFRAAHEFFHIKPYKTSECHEEFNSDDIRVIRLEPKQEAASGAMAESQE